MIRDAVMSRDGLYRYLLYRNWSALWEVTARRPTKVLWVMLNPSTADAEQDDPTIRRCIDFSKRWGYGRMSVVNLFALRATNPKTIHQVGSAVAVGPDNDHWILAEAKSASLIVAAWGACRFQNGVYGRDRAVRQLLAQYPLYHVGLTINGTHPRHPLYVRGTMVPTIWPEP